MDRVSGQVDVRDGLDPPEGRIFHQFAHLRFGILPEFAVVQLRHHVGMHGVMLGVQHMEDRLIHFGERHLPQGILDALRLMVFARDVDEHGTELRIRPILRLTAGQDVYLSPLFDAVIQRNGRIARAGLAAISGDDPAGRDGQAIRLPAQQRIRFKAQHCTVRRHRSRNAAVLYKRGKHRRTPFSCRIPGIHEQRAGQRKDAFLLTQNLRFDHNSLT